MIRNLLLHLLVQRLNVIRHPGADLDESDREEQQLAGFLAEDLRDLTWRNDALGAYVVLRRGDLAGIPTRTHHWFVEELALDERFRQPREGFYADLYDLMDPVGKFVMLESLTRWVTQQLVTGEETTVFRELDQLTEGLRDAAGREFVDLLLDVWLSDEAAAIGERGERSIPQWLAEIVRSAQYIGGLREQIPAAFEERAAMLDPVTADALMNLARARER